ncbi:MAG: alpha/beta hydrolase [Bryobacterales bacterium]
MRFRGWIVAALVASLGYFMIGRLVDSMTFYPSRYPQGRWELQRELGAEDVELRSPDGLLVHAWLVPAVGARRATVLYLHGNAGNLSDREEHLRSLAKAGAETLILDYRGYGKSEGAPSEQNLYEDADAGYDWLLEQGRREERLVAYGESLGTAAATDLASRRGCGALVLEAPFPSRSAVAALVVPFLGPLVARGFETARKIPSVRCPVLVIHGTADAVIPFEMGRRVFEAANEPKTFWRVPGARHVDPEIARSEEFRERMGDLFEDLRPR